VTDQSWFWTPEWQAGEREADADIAAGRVRTFENVHDLLAWLMTDDPETQYDPPAEPLDPEQDNDVEPEEEKDE